jgi:hypothetical protein
MIGPSGKAHETHKRGLRTAFSPIIPPGTSADQNSELPQGMRDLHERELRESTSSCVNRCPRSGIHALLLAFHLVSKELLSMRWSERNDTHTRLLFGGEMDQSARAQASAMDHQDHSIHSCLVRGGPGIIEARKRSEREGRGGAVRRMKSN